MMLSKISIFTACALFTFNNHGLSQPSGQYRNIPLDNFNAFNEPSPNWVIASDAISDPSKSSDIKPVTGQGAAVNVFTRNGKMQLITKEEYGDIDLQFDFMLPNNGASTVYIQGRYPLLLKDSWMKTENKTLYSGTIVSGQNKDRGTTDRQPPFMNAAKASGLWQHLALKFRAPHFDGKGMKITNARFEEVYLNGALIQEEVSITSPSTSSPYTDEKSSGPLVFTGDEGPAAIKNISVRPLPENNINLKKDSSAEQVNDETVNPVLITADARPYLLRSFVFYGDKKLTHVISVGHPNQVNFSYDLKQGAIFYIWRGPFMDVTQMWVDRGEDQNAFPQGAVTVLPDAPPVAVLNDPNNQWPDSVAFDDINNHGYTLNNKRMPVFSYTIKGLEVKDSVSIMETGEGISRTLTIGNPSSNTYCRIASGSSIENNFTDLYAVNGKSYYIRLDKKYKPLIRNSANGKELLVKYEGMPVSYSIIW